MGTIERQLEIISMIVNRECLPFPANQYPCAHLEPSYDKDMCLACSFSCEEQRHVTTAWS